jgi:4-hydroxy-tetrahydrodipicolinate synthase
VALINENSKGVYVIGATPFRDDLSLDTEGIAKLTDFYIETGATGFTVLGMMGEAAKLSTAESRAVVEGYIKAAGDLPVVVGVSAGGFSAMSELTKSVMDLGAAGVMIAPPNTLRTDDQILAYYQMAGDTLGPDVPIVLQDFPLATSVQISVGTLNKIIQSVPSIKMLKHEDWPGLAKINALRKAESEGQRRISILCGNAGVFLAEEMERGADGAMTGFAYVEMMRDVVKYAGSGEVERAMDIFDAYLPLVRYEQQPGLGLAVRKFVLRQRGAIASDAIRRPGPKLSPADIKDVERLIARQTRRLEEIA